ARPTYRPISGARWLSFQGAGSMKSPLKASVICAALAVAIVGAYLSSVIWRVSIAEKKLFGCSYLLPMSRKKAAYNECPSRLSCGDGTYSFISAGKLVPVHKQMITGFQHVFASALIAFEVSDGAADILLRAYEYGETFLSSHGSSIRHYQTCRKDLFNNRVGRAIGADAKSKGVFGRQAQKYIVGRVLQAMDSNIVIPHYRDARVRLLPSPEQYGCPGLPKPTELARLDRRPI